MCRRALRPVALAAAGLLLLPTILLPQERHVTGRVVADPSGEPLHGARVTVLAPGRSARVLTAEDGRFAMGVPAGDVRLEVHSFGYVPATVPVPAEQTTVEVALEPDVFRLSELVVTGQATTIDRRSATTAIAYVAGEDVSRVSTPTVLHALAGKVSGVNLQTNSGAPGGGIQMQVRGNATLLGGFDPLFVVDGVIYSNASLPGPRGLATRAFAPAWEADAVNRIADLNPADIATIEILKGAAASSIYGSKAAHGVVVITTVRGQAGAPRARVTQRVGIYSPLRLLETRRWTADSAIARYGEAAVPFFQDDPNPYFDHYRTVYGNRRPSYETLLTVSGGSLATRYHVSGSWKRDEGIERNTFAEHQGIRVNVDQELGPAVQLSVSSAYSRAANDRGWNNNCNNFACHGYAIAYTPSFVDIGWKHPDGSYPRPTVGVQSNPLQLTELGVNHEETHRFNGAVRLSWQALDSERQRLRIVAGGGLDAFDQRHDVWTPNELFFEQVSALPGTSLESGWRSVFHNWNVNAVHDWLAGGVTATTSFGVQHEARRLHFFLVSARNLLPGQRRLSQGTHIAAGELFMPERTVALYGQQAVRLLDDRLLLLAGVRAERSSVNGNVDRYYVFPKASVSYRFLEPLGAGSEVKLRLAYGETGNQPQFGQKFTNLATPRLGGQQGLTVGIDSGSGEIEPERLREWEAGIDGEAFQRRLSWELTGFTRNTTNLLLQRVPAPSTGFRSQTINGGKIRNRGIEAGLGYTPVLTRNASWVLRGTFTRYTSRVLDLAGLPPFFPAGSGFGSLGRSRIEVGKPVTQIVGFDFDENGERAATLSQLGNSAPDFRVGLASDVTYRAVRAGAIVDWQQGGNVINNTQYLMDDGRTSRDWGTARWEARYQGYLKGVIRPYIEHATFVKLRELFVDVDVPARVTGALGLGARSLRVGAAARNVFMWTRYSGLDPEVANFGVAAVRNNLDLAPYPPSRGLFFHVSVEF